jgi:hypothetical protein
MAIAITRAGATTRDMKSIHRNQRGESQYLREGSAAWTASGQSSMTVV